MERKKSAPKHVSHRADQSGNPAGDFGISDYHADKKRSRSARQPQYIGAQRQDKAPAQTGDQHRFFGLRPGQPTQQPHHSRRQEGAKNQHRDAEDGQFGNQHSRIGQAGRSGGGEAGKNGQEYYSSEVFYQEYAHDGSTPAGTQIAGVTQTFQQYGRAADRQGATQIQAVDSLQTQDGAGDPHTEKSEYADLNDTDNQHPKPDAADPAPSQLQPYSEEEQHQSKFCQQADGVQVADERSGQRKRPYQESGQQVTQHGRLPDQPG